MLQTDYSQRIADTQELLQLTYIRWKRAEIGSIASDLLEEYMNILKCEIASLKVEG